MKWLADLFSPLKSHLFAMVGVLAVCGLGAAVISYIHIRTQRATIEAQSKTIDLQAETNEKWAQNWKDMKALRQIDQDAVSGLQTQLSVIAQDNDDMADSIKNLEATNAEIKEYMSRPIPDELRRLLQQK